MRVSIAGVAVHAGVLAVILAVLGLVTSAASLAWRFITRRLAGARVRCELGLALRDDGNPAGTAGCPASGPDAGLAFLLGADRSEFPRGAALVAVSYRGRAAVSVRSPVLQWGRGHCGGMGTRARGFEMPAGFCRAAWPAPHSRPGARPAPARTAAGPARPEASGHLTAGAVWLAWAGIPALSGRPGRDGGTVSENMAGWGPVPGMPG